jgi:hypothetical protein
LAVELVPIEVKARNDIAAAIAMVAARQAAALVVIEDPLFIADFVAKIIDELGEE